jgi:photosystem II stability/assembly factor-like uncharacterized protein
MLKGAFAMYCAQEKRRMRKIGLRCLPCFLVSAVWLLAHSRAADAGINVWTSNGPFGGLTRAIAIDPSNPLIVYAGLEGGGVLKSTDGGANWRQLGPGVIASASRGLAINNQNPAIVYAAGEARLFKSTDAGASWRGISFTIPSLLCVATDPSQPSVVFVGTAGGLAKSTDGGESLVFWWQRFWRRCSRHRFRPL